MKEFLSKLLKERNIFITLTAETHHKPKNLYCSKLIIREIVPTETGISHDLPYFFSKTQTWIVGRKDVFQSCIKKYQYHMLPIPNRYNDSGFLFLTVWTWKCKLATFPLIKWRFVKVIKGEQRPFVTRTDPQQTVYTGMHKHNGR